MSMIEIPPAASLAALFPSEYPAYPLSEWREAVADGETLLGYWDWVHSALTAEANDGTPASLAGVLEVTREHLGPLHEVRPDAHFAHCGADSLDVIEIAMAIEDRFKVELPDEELANITTPLQLAALVDAKLAAFA